MKARSLPPAAPVEQGQTPLAWPWSAPIAGPAAPHELLLRLAGLATSADHRRLTAAGPATADNGRRPAAGAPLEAGDNGGTLEGTASGFTSGDTAGAGAIRASVLPLSPWERELGGGGRIAPPAVAPQLPPLIPPQVVGQPVQPVAAATARQGALAEATAAEDDLSLLAAKIKRILDEEARRHGIEV